MSRVFFYVQHLLGVGHLRRAEVLADAMAAVGQDVTVALGGAPVPEVPFRTARIVQLPPTRLEGDDFSTLFDAAGRPVDEAWKLSRAAALRDACRHLDPDVVLIELFPFGRRQFRFELEPLLTAIHRSPNRPRVACSVRDILVASKKPGRDDETVGTLRRFFDAVLVHGDPALVPFGATFTAADRIADLIRYTGYVAAASAASPTNDGAGEVLVSAGGGAVGLPLLHAALAARPSTPLKDHVWRFLAGPNLPEASYRSLAAQADSQTIVERFRPDFAARLHNAALSISQAGYNTTMDILASGVPAVVIPYETPGETEQRLRSDILARRGVLTVVPAATLSAASLAAGIESALARLSRESGGIDLDGASATARLIAELATLRPVAKA